MKKALKIVLAIIAVLIIAAILFAIFSPKPLPQMTTAVVEQGTVTQTIDLSGNLAYPQTRQVAFTQSGQVDGVYVALGSIVFEGDILAKFADGATKLPDGSTVTTTGLLITAPISGVVTGVLATPDTLVAAGQPVVVIDGPTRSFQVHAQVTESDVVTLSMQAFDATVTVDALPGVTFAGFVTSIAPSAIPLQGVVSYDAIITLDHIITDGKGGFDDLRAGMSASVSVITKTISDAIHIPQRAVLTHDDGSKFVRVISDNKEFGYDERAVIAGLRGDNGIIVITDGLAVGEPVVVSIKK
jgi:multidrug efflux pump subunit AcrA (membrane-fusion protein)